MEDNKTSFETEESKKEFFEKMEESRDKFFEELKNTDRNNLKSKVFELDSEIMKESPEKLFRFRSCNENNFDAFLNDKVYHSYPKDFNDPYDSLGYVDMREFLEALYHSCKKSIEDIFVDNKKLIEDIFVDNKIARDNSIKNLDTTRKNCLEELDKGTLASSETQDEATKKHLLFKKLNMKLKKQ